MASDIQRFHHGERSEFYPHLPTSFYRNANLLPAAHTGHSATGLLQLKFEAQNVNIQIVGMYTHPPLKLYSKSIDPSPSLSNVTNSTVQCGKFAMMVIGLQPSLPLWADLLFNTETGAKSDANKSCGLFRPRSYVLRTSKHRKCSLRFHRFQATTSPSVRCAVARFIPMKPLGIHWLRDGSFSPNLLRLKSSLATGAWRTVFFQMGKWKSDWGQTHNIRNQHATNGALSDGQQMPELLVSEHRQRLSQEWYRVPRSKHTFQNSRPLIWRVLALIPAPSFISSQVPVFLSIHVTGPTFVREICFGGTQLRSAKSIKIRLRNPVPGISVFSLLGSCCNTTQTRGSGDATPWRNMILSSGITRKSENVSLHKTRCG